MVHGHLDDAYYHLVKDYGITVVFYKVGKNVIDDETGVRSTAEDKQYQIEAIFTPVDTYVEFLHSLLGRTEKSKTDFMVRISDLPEINPEQDYIKHGNLKYRNLTITKFGGEVGILTGEAV